MKTELIKAIAGILVGALLGWGGMALVCVLFGREWAQEQQKIRELETDRIMKATISSRRQIWKHTDWMKCRVSLESLGVQGLNPDGWSTGNKMDLLAALLGVGVPAAIWTHFGSSFGLLGHL